MTVVRVRCAGCGVVFSVADMRGRPKWCSERCRRRTLYGGRCVVCGVVTDGSRGRPGAPRLCRRCQFEGVLRRQHEQALERRVLIEGLWAQGLSARQVSERLGLGWKFPANAISNLRSKGFVLPHRRTAEQIARMTAGADANLARARARRRVAR